MEQLPYELSFYYRFNLHKLAGLLIEDNDHESIARICGVTDEEIKAVDEELREKVHDAAVSIRAEMSYIVPGSSASYLALGDSITSDRLSYAKIIRALWQDNPDRKVIDAGISADTTSDVINRIYTDVLLQEFDRATIFIGTNDCRGQKDTYKMTNTSVGEYENNLHYLISRLKDTGARVWIITLPPVHHERFETFFGRKNNSVYNDAQLAKMNTLIRKAAKKFKTGLIDLASEIESSGIDALDEDGLHLNLEAQTLLARLLLPVLG
jgi:lysophospholipase L1-like esterase